MEREKKKKKIQGREKRRGKLSRGEPLTWSTRAANLKTVSLSTSICPCWERAERERGGGEGAAGEAAPAAGARCRPCAPAATATNTATNTAETRPHGRTHSHTARPPTPSPALRPPALHILPLMRLWGCWYCARAQQDAVPHPARHCQGVLVAHPFLRVRFTGHRITD